MTVTATAQEQMLALRALPRTRSVGALALLVLVIAFECCSLALTLASLSQPTTGLVYAPSPSREPRAFVTTDAASWAVRSFSGEVLVRSVNGHAPEPGRPFLSPFAGRVRTEPGALNHFVLSDRKGQLTEVDLAVTAPNALTLLRHHPEELAFPLVGFIYLVLGALVFLRRPHDRASRPLLLFSCVAAVNMGMGLHLSPWTLGIACLRSLVAPLYAPALVNFGLQFTGLHQRPSLQRLLVAFVVVALAVEVFALYAWGAGVTAAGERAYRTSLVVLLALSVLATAGISFAAARRSVPLGLRRRARVLGIATFASFFVPSLSILWTELGVYWLLIVGLLACFPIVIAYAIARLGMFDMRFVLGQGLLYALLSVGLLLGYVGLVFAAIRVLGATADQPVVLFGTVLVSVLLLSLLQLRVQGAINRVVFRSRYVLGDALAEASQQLARARSRGAVIDTARSALLDAMKLTRAAVALVEPGQPALRCTVLGSGPTPWTAETPASLPEVIDPAQLPPIARALATMETVSAHDTEAVSAQLAQSDGVMVNAQGTCEATFWQRYGIEWVVPMRLGGARGGRRVVGLLLLGPKRDGRSLDASDRALLATLANQLAVAVDGADAFEQLRALKESLEAQVHARTRDLSEALTNLQSMQSHLVEAEKQAVLGRVAAGIVHEINSPLGSLRSAVDTTGRLMARVQPYLEAPAARGDLEAQRLLAASGEGGSLVSAMRRSGERIESLVSGLKRFASLDEGHRKMLDVREGIESALTLLSPSLQNGIRVTRYYPSADDEAPHVECDPGRLNQVFLSVLENAVHACGQDGEITVEVTRARDHVKVAVRDNGCGIAAERIPSLFEVGFTRKQGRVALRLGLPASRRAIEELGGTIAVASEQGQGTRVSIALPAAQAAGSPV